MSILSKNSLAKNQKAYKYQFSLQILKLKCEIPFPCTIKFMWKRNTKGIQTKFPHQVKAGYIQLQSNQKLSSISTVIYNTDQRQFLPKQSQIIVNMLFNGSPKKLASYQLDMRSILDPNNYKSSRSESFDVSLKVYSSTSKQYKDCRMLYRLTSVFKQQVIYNEQNPGATLSMSGFSTQDNRVFQRKYDIPSKDNHSVASYTPSLARYPSATKRQKDDSSIKRYQYGQYSSTMKSNQYDLKSVGRSIDNRTDVNQPATLSRQLNQQQNKRSKLEAQLAKNNIEVQQLKKKISQLAVQNMKLKEGQNNIEKQSAQKNKSFSDLNHQLQQLRIQFSKVENDRNIYHRQILRLRDLQQKYNNLSVQHTKIKQQSSYYQQKIQQTTRNLQRLQTERASYSPSKFLPQINELQRRLNQNEGEAGKWKQKCLYFQQQVDRVNKINEQLQFQLRNTKQQMFRSNVSNVSLTTSEHEKMFRQTLQLQVDLKFANDQLQRLRGIQQAYDGEKWKAQKQFNERHQAEKDRDRIQKQLMNKNRALLIEVQKTKMMSQQMKQLQINLNQVRQQLQKSKNIIYHGQKQVVQMQMHIRSLQQDHHILRQDNIHLQEQLGRVQNNSQQINNLQSKIHELQARNTEKLQSIERMNSSIISLNRQIKQLQKRNQQIQKSNQKILKQQYLKDKIIQQNQAKMRQSERYRQSYDSQINKIAHQKKLLQKRIEMVMEQMHTMKKKYQQQKTRSVSLTRNQDLSKLRNIQLEVEKKQKLVSKLTKQKLELEQQNVKVNVQVMKLLSELQKLKQTRSFLK